MTTSPEPTTRRVVLITGAASGLGAATARRFLREGWQVVINHLDAGQKAAAAEIAALASAPGQRAIAVEADVTRDDDCVRLVQAAVDAFGRLDALVNAAGISKMVAHPQLHDLSADDFQRIYAVNTVGHEFAHRPIPIKVGERVRLYLINIIEFDLINSLHLHAEFFDYYDHGTTLEPTHRTVDTIIQCQAQRGLVEFSYRWPGQYMFHAHQSEFAELGWMGFFRALPEADWANGLTEAGVDAEWDQLGIAGSTVDPVSKEVAR